MELSSRKSEFSNILKGHGLELSVEDFKHPSELSWSLNQPSHVKRVWRAVWESLEGAEVLEEPTTGYFFGGKYDEQRRKWMLTYSPNKSGPRPQTRRFSDGELIQAFEEWAVGVKRELQAPRPWESQLQAGSTPFTLEQLAKVALTLASHGLVPAGLELYNWRGDLVIKVREGWATFDIRAGWYVKFRPGSRPGMITREEERGPLQWEQLIQALTDWTGYWRRESETD